MSFKQNIDTHWIKPTGATRPTFLVKGPMKLRLEHHNLDVKFVLDLIDEVNSEDLLDDRLAFARALSFKEIYDYFFRASNRVSGWQLLMTGGSYEP